MRDVLVLVAVAVLVAGCGGSQPRLTRAAFSQRANAVCARYTTLVRSVVSSAASTNLMSVQSAVTRALPVARAGNDELRGLRPPTELQDAWDRWLDASDRQLKGLEQLENAAEKSDVDGVVAALKSLAGTNVGQARLDAAALGLSECGALVR